MERPLLLESSVRTGSELNVHVVEKITTLGSAKTTVIEIQPRSKSSDKSSQSSRSETPNETPGKVQRKRKVEASEDKAIKGKIRKAETVSRNERQKKELTDLNTELNKLAGSSAIDELNVKCGVCKEKRVIAGDRTVSGKVQNFLNNIHSYIGRLMAMASERTLH